LLATVGAPGPGFVRAVGDVTCGRRFRAASHPSPSTHAEGVAGC